jgi:hypothetical protein
MRRFRCACGQQLFFDNVACGRCGRTVGFAADLGRMVTLLPASQGVGRLPVAGKKGLFYRLCGNSRQYAVCNWLVPADRPGPLCLACGLNRTVPDLSREGNRERWGRLEAAKRRLVYTLLRLGLPLVNRREDPAGGLAFDFLEDQRSSPAVPQAQVATGHAEGVITINVLEADPIERVRAREHMNEQYRTLLGHMRHESGHYYWNRLIRDAGPLARFRELFGDESADYAASLQQYYRDGPPPDWSQHFISSYASAHPWEDWAETWAHYLHMSDTLETAQDFRLAAGEAQPATSLPDFDARIAEWLRLTVMLNELNRSMGQDDSYPFVVPAPVIEKLRFIDELVEQAAGQGVSPYR